LMGPSGPRVVVAAYGHACGVRVQRVLRVMRFDSGLWPLRVVVAAMGPLRGRVQRVQMVHKVQRVVVSPSAMSIKTALRDLLFGRHCCMTKCYNPLP
jgi:hypothetical protein